MERCSMVSKKKSNRTQSKKHRVNTELKAINQKQTKVEILRAVASETGLSPRQVKEVFAVAGHLSKCHLIKKGSGEFTIPEMAVKIVRKTKPATKKREGRNPMTGETIIIAAKPRREVIKVRPLKSLKEILA